MNIAIAIGIGAAALIAIPFALPSAVTIERTAMIEATPDDVYEIFASNAGFQKINPWKDADPNLKITLSGPDHGVGSSFHFAGSEGKGTQTITALDRGRRVVTKIDLGPMGQPVQTFTMEPAAGGTRVTWSTEAKFGMNPIGRVFGLFMDGQLGPVYERGLANLAKAV